MTVRVLRDQRGLTLMELIVAMVIMGFLVTSILSFVRQQEMAFGFGTGRMSALQSYRFAADLLERNIRTAGTGTVTGQPFLVYADSMTLAFNADYASNDPGDVFAVYRDLAAGDAEVGSLTSARRHTLPQTSFAYPDSTYRDGGATSPAETIVFYFAPDATTPRRDDFVLYRRVNDLAPEVVARNLLRDERWPFFRYQEVVTSESAPPEARWVLPGALPLRHSAPIHMSPADTGVAARIDRVRAVQVSFRASDGRREETSQDAALRRLIRMPNAGHMRLQTCGDPPQFTSGVTAALVPGESRVEVSWIRAVDEAAGEQDVIRYAIFRRVGGAGAWGEPYFSVPAGKNSYSYVDSSVDEGVSYQYAVAAQDCTPSLSAIRTSGLVTVPVTP